MEDSMEIIFALWYTGYKRRDYMFWQTQTDSPLGPITLASDGSSLCGLWLEGQLHFCSTVKEPMPIQDNLSVFEDTRRWLDAYFSKKRPDPFSLPLAPAGTLFRRQVWQLLLEIPYGSTTTYGSLSRKIAAMRGLPSMSAQAVAGAIGHNPISIIIPCHRVIGADGSMTGYAGGINRKLQLLTLEDAVF